jgi:hypothetical protein
MFEFWHDDVTSSKAHSLSCVMGNWSTLKFVAVVVVVVIIIIIIISNLSYDRSTASSKTIPPLNAI